MNSKKLVRIINTFLLKKMKRNSKSRALFIHYNIICNNLKEYYGKPRHILKAFFLTKEQMEKGPLFVK